MCTWAQCEAGRQAAFVILARDRHGHSVCSGGAVFAIEVSAGAETVQGAHAQCAEGAADPTNMTMAKSSG